jgi:PBSX family phage terminase large subunit
MSERPYNPAQLKFIDDIKKNKVKKHIILEGSVRSGKTWISLVAWMHMVSRAPQREEFLMIAKTTSTLKRNCLNLLQRMTNNRFTYSLGTQEGWLFQRRIHLVGANDAQSEKKIRGMTVNGAYCDELTTIPKDFYDMLLSRLTRPRSFLLATTNPDTPTHWLKTGFINQSEKKDHQVYHFNLEDNHTISLKDIEIIKNQYDGVFYERFILGKWVAAEGLIYSKFANEKQKYIVDKIRPYDLMTVHIGIDYGASKSRTAFVALGFTKGFQTMYVLKEKTTLGVKAPEEMFEGFYDFYKQIEGEYGSVSFCYADWGGLGQNQTRGIEHYFIKKQKPIKIKDCLKVRIIERINMLCRLIGSDKFKIHKSCTETIEALCSAVWEDGKIDTRLDDGTVNIDVLDAMEYAYTNYMQKLNNSFNVPKVIGLPII